ncbi:HAMP domain-containing sensor histidine kinase [Halarcobacter sp.]|uniref:sensor histidine kinase n=1 Tax=Halarcobacter sp. TaxID=2321133 RepID=UPI002AAB957D|nr:HAMP domain-containing sensor histidine kinase [Halarcobacter sp.]
METHKLINTDIVKKLFEDSDKLIFVIDKQTKILNSNKTFYEQNFDFIYMTEFITYTHIKDFKNKINTLNSDNKIIKLMSNFSFNNQDVEDIPTSYNVILFLNKDNTITVVAEPRLALSQADAKLYLSLINDFSNTSRELTKTKQKLKYLNDNLEEEIKKAVKEINEKNEIILKQSRDAMMGEMIDSIAHQWKSPLSVIKLIADSINLDIELFDGISEEELKVDTKKIIDKVDHLLETLDEFRNFFRPDIQTQTTCLFELTNSVSVLLKDELIKHKININVNNTTNKKVELIQNQFKHVLINLISNSKDAYIEHNISQKNININIFENEDFVVLEFLDQAGGIPENILEKIFEANFTTKQRDKGTGIGLYLTKQIIEKIDAEIKVFNKEKGTCFQILFPIKKD